jgi:hypothetical protein
MLLLSTLQDKSSNLYTSPSLLVHDTVLPCGWWEQTKAYERQRLIPFTDARRIIAVPLGEELFEWIIVILYIEKGGHMFIVAVLVAVLIIAVLAGADLLVAEFNSDELSNMGVERKS